MFKLEIGHRVKLNNGGHYIVVPVNMVQNVMGNEVNGLFLADEDGYLKPEFSNSEWGIHTVYDRPLPGSYALKPSKHGDLLWDREADVKRAEAEERLRKLREQVENLNNEIHILEAELE